MKKILVLIDFSKSSIEGLRVACDYAQKANSSVLVLHVVEGAPSESFRVSGDSRHDSFLDDLYTYKLIESSKKRLEKLIQLPQYASVRLEAILRMGNPFHAMTTVMKQHKLDMVVMGKKGQTQIENMLIGSNTEKIIRHAQVPVLTVHKKPTNTNFKNIVYATNMAKKERPVVALLKQFQHVYKSKIHLLNINTPSSFQRDHDLRPSMDKFANAMAIKNYTVNVYNDFDVEGGILRFSDEIKASIIVLATHGRTGFAQILAGSITEGVARHAKRLVITQLME